jgi:hypothetical protein
MPEALSDKLFKHTAAGLRSFAEEVIDSEWFVAACGD